MFVHRIHPVALALVLPLVACVSTPSGRTEATSDEWLDASPALAEQIDRNARRLPWVHGVEQRMELIHWFASVGEPAYPTLLDLVEDPRPHVSGAAYAALGSTRDARLVEYIRARPMPAGSSPALTLERARTLLVLGDWSTAPVIIDGLRDDRPIVRALCAKALFEVTGERFGYDPSADAPAREAGVQRWESWWHDRAVDPLLAQN